MNRIRTNKEQEEAAVAAIVDCGVTDGYVSFQYLPGENWEWIVDSVESYPDNLDQWFDNQDGLARVYGVKGQKVWIRNAK